MQGDADQDNAHHLDDHHNHRAGHHRDRHNLF